MLRKIKFFSVILTLSLISLSSYGQCKKEFVSTCVIKDSTVTFLKSFNTPLKTSKHYWAGNIFYERLYKGTRYRFNVRCPNSREVEFRCFNEVNGDENPIFLLYDGEIVDFVCRQTGLYKFSFLRCDESKHFTSAVAIMYMVKE